MVLKSEIHQLVDACEDDSRLEAVEAILKEEKETDWWQLLSNSEKTKRLLLYNRPMKEKPLLTSS